MNFESVAKDLFNTEQDKMMHPIKKVYIDLPYLQDVYFGSLLLKADTKEKFDYLIKNIDSYNKRITLTRAEYFPEIISSEDEFFSDCTYGKKCSNVCAASPFTTLFATLPDFHASVLEHNVKVMPKGSNTNVIYLINSSPLSFSTADARRLKNILMQIDKNITLGLIQKPLEQVDIKLLSDIDIFFVTDISPFCNDATTLGDAFIKQLTFVDKVLYSPKRIGDLEVLKKYPSLSDTEKDTVFIDTATILNLYCNFYYLDVELVLK